MSESERTPRIIEVDLSISKPDLGQCEHMMRGRTKRRRRGETTIHRTPWQARCPNRAIVRYRGRAYCQQHRPASSVTSAEESAT